MTDKLVKEIAERFRRDTANHQMTVRHDDGLYRHLYCAKSGTGIWSFHVVTWPGTLAVHGDINGAYVFRRIDDMFEFFRMDRGRINPTYWSEKLAGGRDSVTKYSEDIARRHITECLDEYEKDTYPYLLERFTSRAIPSRPASPDEVRQMVTDYDEDDYLAHADGARDVLRELEKAGATADTWEWDLTDWDWSFLWACHAIAWAIAQYDAARQATVTVELPGVSR